MSSLLIELAYNGHRHNGVEKRIGDKIRVSADVAVAMKSRGQCNYCTGADLVKERDERKAKAKPAEKKKEK